MSLAARLLPLQTQFIRPLAIAADERPWVPSPVARALGRIDGTCRIKPPGASVAAREVKVRHPIISRLYVGQARKADELGLADRRRGLLSSLSGRVVEIGAGSGTNFAYYRWAACSSRPARRSRRRTFALYERWKSNRKVFVGALSEVTEEVFDLYPPPEGGRCIDIGCGFGETSQRLAQLVGTSGSVLGTDSSPRFIEDARREAAEAGVANIEFEVADAQTAAWEPVYHYAFSRMGTQFFAAPVPAMRGIRAALKPGGRLAKVCWRRKNESPFWAETEQVVERFLSRPEEYEADTCGPGPFSLGNPETTRGILKAAGFADIELHQRDFDYFMGADMEEAIDSLLAIGPGAELIRLNGDHGESRRGEIADALREHYAAWQKPDGSIVGRGSVWIVAATNSA